MATREKPVWTFRVCGTHHTPTRSTARARDVEMVIDEPIERGGTNRGPMPVEAVMMGLLGCTHVIANKLARANGVEITAMDVEVTTKMDSHGTRLIRPVDIPFPEVHVAITADMSGPEEGMDAIVAHLRHHCAVSKMLQQSGSQVTEAWVINGAPRAPA